MPAAGVHSDARRIVRSDARLKSQNLQCTAERMAEALVLESNSDGVRQVKAWLCKVQKDSFSYVYNIVQSAEL